MSLELILFDLDGTLVNSIGDITDALNHALLPYGLKKLTPAETVTMVGEGPARLVTKALSWCGLEVDKDEIVNRFLDYYSLHPVVYTVPYPGVIDTLEKLSYWKKAIVTNKTEDVTMKVLNRLNMTGYFNMIVGVDTIPERKPSPEPVRHVLSTLGVTSEKAIIVGDSRIDMETGKAALLKTVAVTYGYGQDGFEAAGDYLIDDITRLVGIANSLSYQPVSDRG